MRPPWHRHDLIKNRINELLYLFLHANQHLRLSSNVGMAVEISQHDTFVPDVSVIRKDRLGGEQRILGGAPELASEVASATDSTERLKAKVDAYLQGGSQAVWVVFPGTSSVVVYSRDAVRELNGDQSIEDALLPGFSAAVSAFFEAV
jgi:Uma2 family endonuclease